NALFDDDPADLVMPGGELILEAEFLEVMGALELLGGVWIEPADLDERAIGKAYAFVEMIEHESASERRGQGGDEQSVVPPGDGAGDGAGSKTAEAIGDKPLLFEQMPEI